MAKILPADFLLPYIENFPHRIKKKVNGSHMVLKISSWNFLLSYRE